MKRMKKSLVVLLAVSMLLSMASVAMAADGSYEDPWVLAVGGSINVTLAASGQDGAQQFVGIDNTVTNVITAESSWGDTWTIQYGKVSYADQDDNTFTVEAGGWDTLIVTNASDHEITLTISAVTGEASDEPDGTIDDPFELEIWDNYDGSYSGGVWGTSVEAGSDGLYYTFVAPGDGLVVGEPSLALIQTGVDEYGWNTYDIVGIKFYVANLSTSVYADPVTALTSEDTDKGVKSTVEATAGDEILVYINTYDPDSAVTPSADSVSFSVGIYPSGFYQNPEVVGTGTYTIETPYSSGYYYYKFVATLPGTLTVTVSSSGDQGWLYSIDDIYYSSAYESPNNSPSREVACKAGDEVVVYATAVSPLGEVGGADAYVTVTFAFASDSEEEETPNPDEETPATDPGEETPDESGSEEELPATDDEEELPATDGEEELPATDGEEESSATDAEEESSSTGTGSVVTTGDSSPIVPFMVLAVVSAAVALGAIVLKKKVA